jgi:hypothetical protein
MALEVWEYGDGTAETTDYGVADLPVLQGDGNSPPLVSDTTMQRDSSLLQILGSIGSTARDLGTAVGTVKRDFEGAKDAYGQAYRNASTGNSLGTWWQYASTTDKLMVGLAVAGILVVLLKK